MYAFFFKEKPIKNVRTPVKKTPENWTRPLTQNVVLCVKMVVFFTVMRTFTDVEENAIAAILETDDYA